jgi:DNA (cytosine-5)-methyltransferase 1
MECVGQVEIEPYCLAVLAHHWPHVKREKDIRNVTRDTFGAADLICGGFPCQPFSYAGNQRGSADHRYLWPEMLRVVELYGPSWFLGENVAGIIGLELNKVIADLEKAGYDFPRDKDGKPIVFLVPACAKDAPHRRDRVWILAYRNEGDRGSKFRQSQEEWAPLAGPGCERDVAYAQSLAIGSRFCQSEQEGVRSGRSCNGCGTDDVSESERERCEAGAERTGRTEGANFNRRSEKANVAYPSIVRMEGEREFGEQEPSGLEQEILSYGSCERSGATEWEPEPAVGRLAHGVPNRVAQLRALGNAVVPQVVEEFGKVIMRTERVRADRQNAP